MPHEKHPDQQLYHPPKARFIFIKNSVSPERPLVEKDRILHAWEKKDRQDTKAKVVHAWEIKSEDKSNAEGNSSKHHSRPSNATATSPKKDNGWGNFKKKSSSGSFGRNTNVNDDSNSTSIKKEIRITFKDPKTKEHVSTNNFYPTDISALRSSDSKGSVSRPATKEDIPSRLGSKINSQDDLTSVNSINGDRDSKRARGNQPNGRNTNKASTPNSKPPKNQISSTKNIYQHPKNDVTENIGVFNSRDKREAQRNHKIEITLSHNFAHSSNVLNNELIAKQATLTIDELKKEFQLNEKFDWAEDV